VCDLYSIRHNDEESALDSSSRSSNSELRLRNKPKKKASGRLRIVRLGAKPYYQHPGGGPNGTYTTRKHSYGSVLVSAHGVAGDYNHYRSVALHNTTDRAVSIVTRNTLDYVRANGYPIQAGDLGENVLLDAAAGSDDGGGDESSMIGSPLMRPGTMLHVVGATASTSRSGAVVLQISEPMVPCANLCTLHCIQNAGDGTATPRQRVEACQELLQLLDAHVGLRGWYARVLQSGDLRVGDRFEILEP
jgi:MOSC domain-containing protein YiiM